MFCNKSTKTHLRFLKLLEIITVLPTFTMARIAFHLCAFHYRRDRSSSTWIFCFNILVLEHRVTKLYFLKISFLLVLHFVNVLTKSGVHTPLTRENNLNLKKKLGTTKIVFVTSMKRARWVYDGGMWLTVALMSAISASVTVRGVSLPSISHHVVALNTFNTYSSWKLKKRNLPLQTHNVSTLKVEKYKFPA